MLLSSHVLTNQSTSPQTIAPRLSILHPPNSHPCIHPLSIHPSIPFNIYSSIIHPSSIHYSFIHSYIHHLPIHPIKHSANHLSLSVCLSHSHSSTHAHTHTHTHTTRVNPMPRESQPITVLVNHIQPGFNLLLTGGAQDALFDHVSRNHAPLKAFGLLLDEPLPGHHLQLPAHRAEPLATTAGTPHRAEHPLENKLYFSTLQTCLCAWRSPKLSHCMWHCRTDYNDEPLFLCPHIFTTFCLRSC